MFKKISILFLLIISSLFSVNPARAATQYTGIIDRLQCVSSTDPAMAGNCTVCDAMYLVVIFITWLFGVLGFAVLLMFVWSGFQMITAAGNSSQVQAGKNGIVSSLIGLIIILFSWQIVNLVTNIITKGSIIGTAQFNTGATAKNWYEYCQKDQIKVNPVQNNNN